MFELTQQSLHQWEALCTQDQPPYCTARCPLHVDGKGICTAVEKGNFSKGREIFEKYVLLPRILAAVCEAPCRSKCRRREAGAAIELQLLEQACMTYGKKKQGGSRTAFIRKKTQRVAVVGAGMAGLSVALELGMRGYSVTLLEKEHRAGGRLWQVDVNKLPAEEMEKDFKQLEQVGIVLETDCMVDDAKLRQLLEQYDSVYVSAAALKDLSLHCEIDRTTLMTNVEKLFAGNSDADQISFITDASDGKKAAISIERYLQQASLTLKREQEGIFESKLFTRVEVAPLEAVQPAEMHYTEAEAQQEAARCIQCRCTECLDGCAFLRQYKRYPKQYAREVFNNSTIVMGIHGANGMINSCSLCGQCKVLCPNGFDMGEICKVAREDMVTRGKMPPSTHDFALMDMAFSNGDDYFFVSHQPGTAESRYALFPGCQMGASMPQLVKHVYQDLSQRLSGGVGLILGCCGAIADWAGDQPALQQELEKIRGAWQQLGKPQMITLCPSCYMAFQQAGIPAVHVVDVLQQLGLPAQTVPGKGILAVHDSCTTRFDRALQDGVRQLAHQAGYTVEELPYSREKAHCCGYGGLTSFVNREINEATVQQCITQSPADYLTYCVNCRDQFRRQGKTTRHILELLYGLDETPVADISMRRINRQRLKYEVRKELWGEDIQMQKPTISYHIGEAVRQQLNDRMILETDIVQILEHAHATKEMIYHKTKQQYSSSLRIGNVTFWVEFTIQDGVYEVLHAYSHRMSFEECDVNGAVL